MKKSQFTESQIVAILKEGHKSARTKRNNQRPTLAHPSPLPRLRNETPFHRSVSILPLWARRMNPEGSRTDLDAGVVRPARRGSGCHDCRFPMHDIGGNRDRHQVNTDRNASLSLRSW